MSTQVFHCFPLLPKELQLLIWANSLPRRIVELDVPDRGLLRTYCDVWSTSIENAKPPRISAVCRESRKVAFRHGWPL